MTKIVRFFMNRRTLFWSAMVIILLSGVLFFMRMPKLEDPAVVVKQASVVVVFPGADAETIERDVVEKLEDQLRTLPDVRKITTDVRPGQALIGVEFDLDVPKDEIEQYFDQMRRKVGDVNGSLPQGCMEPIVIDDMMDVCGIFYALSGDGYDTGELEVFAKRLRREIMSVKGVKRVNIGGVQREVIDIVFTPDQLRRNGMLPMLVAQALQSSTAVINAGKVNNGQDRLAVDVAEGAVTPEEIADVLIAVPGRGKVRIGDIAEVSRHEVRPSSGSFFIGQETGVTIMAALEKSAVVPTVGAEVDRRIADTVAELPVGMTLTKVFFSARKG